METKKIDMLRDLPDLLPVLREYVQDWQMRIFDCEAVSCRNFLSPNRREFYQVLLISGGKGLFTLGFNSYYIDKPTIFFIHPSDITSWKNLHDSAGGYSCYFKKEFLNDFPQLATTIGKHGLFINKEKSAISLTDEQSLIIKDLFVKMRNEEMLESPLSLDMMQTYLQLLILESTRIAMYPEPDQVSESFKHLHMFFQLLEQETANINYKTPIRIKTAKEFAQSLSMHPNHLNRILKKDTGQNVSTHIRNRLVEEAKALLLQTDWSLRDIGYSLGFEEQSNFGNFFKKNTGVTPYEFQKAGNSGY